MSNSGNSDSKNKLPFYETLHNTALRAPSQSGVYMWRNPSGTVIYVGKAKKLKNRVTSYFRGSHLPKVEGCTQAADNTPMLCHREYTVCQAAKRQE